MKFAKFLAIGLLCLLFNGGVFALRYSEPPKEGEPRFLREEEEKRSAYKMYLDKGIRYFKKGLYPEAKGFLWEAINLYPQDPDAYINLAIVHMAEDNYDTAIRILKKSKDLAPPGYFQEEILLYNLGLAYFKKENYKEAIDFFSRSLQIYPEFRQAAYYLSLSYERTGQSQKAQTLKEGLDKQLEAVESSEGQTP
ncbi:MAG: tetratricopeptide repeat protein [Candidatus Omnitrophica bacterium]|nr:tetratricopeptide repeat protein [Candidatus Omnitrophota bacterium]